MTLSQPIADLLALAALTPSAAARLIGVSRQAIAAAVKRGDGVTLATLDAWAGALGYRVEVRLRREPPRRQP